MFGHISHGSFWTVYNSDNFDNFEFVRTEIPSYWLISALFHVFALNWVLLNDNQLEWVGDEHNINHR